MTRYFYSSPTEDAMAYVFASLDGMRHVECGENEWLKAIDAALSRDWEPEGTKIDVHYQVEELWEEYLDYTWNLMRMCEVHMMAITWEGSYTEKEDQIISESDAYALYCTLDETLVSRALLDLLAGGAVRICR